MIELELAEMLSQRKRTVRNKIVWRMEQQLTGCVGRLYEDRNAYEPFKVLFLFLSVGTSAPLNPDWWVIDTEKKSHRLPKGDLSLAPRSLTMFKHIQKNQQKQKQMMEQMASVASASVSDSDSSDSDDTDTGHQGGRGDGAKGVKGTPNNPDNDDATVAATMPAVQGGETGVPPGDSLTASPIRRHSRRGRRSSLDFMPAKHRLEFYQAKISQNISLTPPVAVVPVRPPGTGAERGGWSRRVKYTASQSSNEAQQRVERAAEGSYVRLMKARAETRNRAKVNDARKIHGPRNIPVEWTGQVTLIEPVAKGAVNARDFARQLMGLGKETSALALPGCGGAGGGAGGGKRRKGAANKVTKREEDAQRGNKGNSLEERLKIMERQLASRKW